MSISKKEIKNQEKDEQKISNVINQIETYAKEMTQIVSKNKLIIDHEQNDIIQHCILRVDSQDDIIATLDGWNQGHNNIIIWDSKDFTEKQRISFPKSNKLSDICFINGSKGAFIVGGDDKYFRVYLNQQGNEIESKYNYKEIFLFKIKNKINCLKYVEDEVLLIGTKNGPFHQISLINLIAFISNINSQQIPQDKEQQEGIKKVDIIVQQKEIDLHERKINDIFVYEDYTLTIGEDKAIVIYNIKEQKIIQKFIQSSCIRCGYLDKSRSTFYTGNTGGEIIIYEIKMKEEQKQIYQTKQVNIGNYIYQIIAFEFEDTSYFLYSTNKKKWFLCDLESLQTLQESHVYNDYISVLHILSNRNIFLGEGKNLFQVLKIK